MSNVTGSSRSILLTGTIPGPAEVMKTDPYVDVPVAKHTSVRCTT